MKRFAIVSGICASFLLGAALSAAAQDEHKDEKQGTVPRERQEKPQDQARPADRQNTECQNQNPERSNMQRPDENRQEQERRNQDRQNQDRQDQERQNQERQNIDRQRQEQQNVERQRQDQQNRERQGEARPNEDRENGREGYERGRQDQARPEAQPRGQEHARDEQRQAERHRIPDNDFREHFGREHRFAPGRVQIFEGRPRFFYSGYTLELLDPWPSDWSYDQDDCYVDYVDGQYWLFNYRYPGERWQ